MTEEKEIKVDNSGKYPRIYYPIAFTDQLLAEILSAKEQKIKMYGPYTYGIYVRRGLRENAGSAGFWAQAKELALDEDGDIIEKS